MRTRKAPHRRGRLLVLALVPAIGSTALAGTTPLGPGDSSFKTHPASKGMPKYSIDLPGYFEPANVVDTLVSMITGGLPGSVVTTVYRNPANECLAFQYVFEGDLSNEVAIARATLGGRWEGIGVPDAGADASGMSGTGDPMPEWTDGDPYFLARDPITHAPTIQWRASGIGAGLGAGDISSLVWFETTAKIYELAPMAVIDTALVGTGDIFGPGIIIPLPHGAALTGGLALIAVTRRRRLVR